MPVSAGNLFCVFGVCGMRYTVLPTLPRLVQVPALLAPGQIGSRIHAQLCRQQTQHCTTLQLITSVSLWQQQRASAAGGLFAGIAITVVTTTTAGVCGALEAQLKASSAVLTAESMGI